MRAMGSKDSAKECMAAANVPLLPGYHGADQSWQATHPRVRLSNGRTPACSHARRTPNAACLSQRCV
eukprot:4630036-Pleurochrysis_carterae.AAC.1